MEDQLKQRLEWIAGDFFTLHVLMTEGLMDSWKGKAFETHLEMEKALYASLTEILEL